MSQWHAGIDQPSLVAGAKLTVLSDHQVVRVTTDDTLAIETSAGHALLGVVVNRTARDLQLVLADGQSVSLGILVDESLHPPGVGLNVFSRQIWLAH